MAVEKNSALLQVLKIMYSQSKKKRRKTISSIKLYPKSVENRYKNKLSGYYKPLINYINKFLSENVVDILHGDSIRFDVLPGGTFRKMISSLEGWVGIYFPTIEEIVEGQNNVVFMGIGETADQLKVFEDKEFIKQLENGIGVSFQSDSLWWEDVKTSWMENNYNLIRLNASSFVSKINTLVEQAVVNGYSVRQLTDSIKQAMISLSDKKCRLIARDQIGKLQGQVAEAQMEEIGLEMYMWDTSGDERVRSTHIPMDGLLCRWDNANVYSKDGGKTWIDRPGGAVRMHPGQDIQCRCVALIYEPELTDEIIGNNF